jgi:hypothetical protein
MEVVADLGVVVAEDTTTPQIRLVSVDKVLQLTV